MPANAAGAFDPADTMRFDSEAMERTPALIVP
jgi:hypothetical protein